MAASLCRGSRSFCSYLRAIQNMRFCNRYVTNSKSKLQKSDFHVQPPGLVKHYCSVNTEEQPPPGMLRRMWNWFNTYYEEPEISPEEQRERDALLEKLHAMTYGTPPVQPDLHFFKEAFDILIKYNDRVGVNVLWKILMDMNIDPDDELEEKVDLYLEKANQEAAWYE